MKIFSDIYPIVYRRWKKFMRNKFELFSEITWPLLLLVLFGFGIGGIVDSSVFEVSYFSFLAPAVLALMVFGQTFSVGSSMIDDKKNFMKLYLVSPISRLSIFLGIVVSEMVVSLSMALFMALIILFYVGSFSFVNLLLVLLVLILISIAFYGLGIVLSFGFSKNRSFQIVFGIFSTVALFLSGAFYPIFNLPFIFRLIAYVNPLYYGVDALRFVVIGYSESGILLSLFVLFLQCVLLTVLGVYSFSRKLKE
ncbi:ABC transporter permease [Candidatus Woesearchaeota archaeon]|nr:ABC transporter permease [Candidatus Woesearchaeota archaeon]